MKKYIISENLLDKSIATFNYLVDNIKRNYESQTTDFDSFKINLLQSLIFESLQSVIETNKKSDEKYSRNIALFKTDIHEKMIPLFLEIKYYGKTHGITPDLNETYIYDHCIKALEKILTPKNAELLKSSLLIARNEKGGTEDKNFLEKWHIANLLKIAKSDGVYDAEERRFLDNKARKYKVNLREVEDLVDTDSKLQLPQDQFRKIEYFIDVVLMMAADKEIHENERQQCLRVGKALGFPESKIEEALNAFTNRFSKGLPAITAVPDVIIILKEE